MKKLKWILPLVAMAIMIGGCPYNSKVPIDTPSVNIEAALLGKWTKKTAANESFTISKKDDHIYAVVWKDKKTGETEKYTAYISKVGDDSFVNVSDDKAVEKTYYLYKLVTGNNGAELTLHPITENITEEFTRPEDLKAFIEKHKHLSFFYEAENEVLVKAK